MNTVSGLDDDPVAVYVLGLAPGAIVVVRVTSDTSWPT